MIAISMERLRGTARAPAAVAVIAAVLASTAAVAAPKSWDHVANIKAAAVNVAKLQQAKGALGSYEFISACYKTHRLAEDFSAALEGCLVQDYIHSKVTAAVYDKLPAAERQRMGLPSPDELVNGMLGRFGGAFSQYKLSEADARKLIADIDKHGMPEFTKARFPKKGD